MIGAMGKFVNPGGTYHGTGWYALVAVRGGVNNRMKFSSGPRLPLY